MKGVKHLNESIKRTEVMRKEMGNKAGYKTGGRVAAYTAGAMSGEGRLQKVEMYGKNAKPKGK